MVKFVARISTQGEDKRTILIPRELHEAISRLIGKQVKVTLEEI